MFRSLAKWYIQVQINYLTGDLKMDLTLNVRAFLRLFEWFSEAQIIYPQIRNNKEVGFFLSDTHKKQIMWDYYFNLFEY